MTTNAMSVTLPINYSDALERTRDALARQGFGVLTEIDLAATLKAKLDVDIPPQVILGACNPALAHRAIDAEPSIGLLLPCNVVVRALDDGHTLVEALDPQIMMQLATNPEVAEVAAEAKSKLHAALGELSEKVGT